MITDKSMHVLLRDKRERRIRDAVRDVLADFKAISLHAVGSYRHVYCNNPRQEFPSEGSFHVYTAPGIVTINGDACDAYTLYAAQDPLIEIFNTPNPNPYWWAEKLVNCCPLGVASLVEDDDPEITRAWVQDQLEDWCDSTFDDSAAQQAALSTLLFYANSMVPYGDEPEEVYSALLDLKYEHDGETYQPFDSEFLSRYPWRVFTDEWLRVCEMLAWTARQVYEQEWGEQDG